MSKASTQVKTVNRPTRTTIERLQASIRSTLAERVEQAKAA